MRAEPTKTAGNSWARCSIEGAGAALLLMLPLLYLQISPLHTDLYHRMLPMNTAFRGMFVDLVVSIAVCALLARLLDRLDGAGKTLWWLLALDFLLMRLTICLGNEEILSRKISPTRVFVAMAIVGLLVWLARRSWYSAIVRGARMTVVLVGFAIFWILPELGVMAAHREPHDAASFTKAIRSRPQRRIVWILLDELSWDQAFEHRYPGLSLPHFDAMAAESVAFSHVQPAGYYTELVVPSLLQGKIVTAERSDLDGRLSVKTQGLHRWHPYPVESTLFADARRAGWATAVAGWYLPYCRTYAPVLDECYWTFSATPLAGGYSENRSAMWNALAPLRKPLLQLVGKKLRLPTTAQNHGADYEGILEQGQAMIAEGNMGFVMIHLPVPHPAGFYNRKTGKIGVSGSYVDNLALADTTLGELMEEIRKTPLADETTVVVSGDHSWRVPLWRAEFDWTKEDELASGHGRFDPRPMVIAHFPGEENGVRVDQTFPLIAMHEMFEAMIAGEIENAQQLEQWVRKQPVARGQ